MHRCDACHGSRYGNACGTDPDNSNVVNSIDIVIFQTAFGRAIKDIDLDGSGAVIFLDFAVIPNYFYYRPGLKGDTANQG